MCLKPSLIEYFDLVTGLKSRKGYSSTLTAVEIPAHLHSVSSVKSLTKMRVFIAFPILNSKLHCFATVVDLNIHFFNLFLNVIK